MSLLGRSEPRSAVERVDDVGTTRVRIVPGSAWMHSSDVKQPGWYWYRPIGSNIVDVVEVRDVEHVGLAVITLDGGARWRRVTSYAREWAGPLARPEGS